MTAHGATPASTQIVFHEQRHQKIRDRIDELRRIVRFYEQCQHDREHAKETGAMRDATEWLIENAIAISKDPLFT